MARSVVLIGASMGTGDVICQLVEQGRVTNWNRSIVFAGIGTFITGPVSYTFQMFLERMVPGTATAQIVKKTLCNSTFAFCVSLPVMFTAVTLLQPGPNGERRSLSDARRKIQGDLLPTFMAGSLYWPMFNMLVYRFVPVEHRAVASSLIGVVWNVYLAMIANKDAKVPQAPLEGSVGAEAPAATARTV